MRRRCKSYKTKNTDTVKLVLKLSHWTRTAQNQFSIYGHAASPEISIGS